MKITHTLAKIFITSSFICTSSFAATIYVDQATGDDANNGQTPANAVATITTGKTLVSDGDTLDIGPGTYSATTGENYPVYFSNNITLQGAGPDQTFLDGESSSKLLTISDSDDDNTANASINGLAIINGFDGSAVTIRDMAHVTFSNCLFENNDGGVVVYDTSDISVANCHFNNNNAAVGGAVLIQINADIDVDMDVIQSSFSNNTSHIGSSIQFQENGIGMHTLNIDRSRFINNSNSNVSFATNGGISSGQITNSLFTDNSGTALSAYGSDLKVVNSTFVNNGAALFGTEELSVINSIFWNNSSEITGSGGNVSFSIIQDLQIGDHNDGGDNIDTDPLLDIDYRLTENSPAIDMGSDQAVDALGLTEDLDGQFRKFNVLNLNRPEGVVDIGADEYPDIIFEDGFEL